MHSSRILLVMLPLTLAWPSFKRESALADCNTDTYNPSWDIFYGLAVQACDHLFEQKPSGPTSKTAHVWYGYHDDGNKDRTNKVDKYQRFTYSLDGDNGMSRRKCEDAFMSQEAATQNIKDGKMCQEPNSGSKRFVKGWNFEKDGKKYTVNKEGAGEEQQTDEVPPEHWHFDTIRQYSLKRTYWT